VHSRDVDSECGVDRKGAEFICNKQIYSLNHSLTHIQTLKFIYQYQEVSMSTSGLFFAEYRQQRSLPSRDGTGVLVQVYSYYPNESFPEVYVSLHVRRKYMFYITYIIFPCLLLSGLLLMLFLLPADSGEKISLGVSILVAISVFLLLVAGNVPDTSDSVPLLGPYAFSTYIPCVHKKEAGCFSYCCEALIADTRRVSL